ncbi:hypothetical protein BASA62_008414 [Batrachochytrium salamandrivorans]|nr:hypothetical protein BASA62_008414 [Batrachochytrium salamandrivorans]
MGVPLLDQRIRVCVHGVLYNLHLVLVPFFERHTAQNYVKLIKVLLDSLSPIWRDKLEIEVKNATHGVLDESFYKTAHAFSVHLRAQQTLMTEMGSKCPKDTTRWIAFGSILKWLLQHRRQLMSTSDIQLDELDHTTIIVRGDWLIEKESVIMHIHDQGSWVRDLHSSLSNFNQQSTLEEVATFAFALFANGLQIQAERDSNTTTLGSWRHLPVMPADLVKLCPALFIKDILDPYRNHVAKHWTRT